MRCCCCCRCCWPDSSSIECYSRWWTIEIQRESVRWWWWRGSTFKRATTTTGQIPIQQRTGHWTITKRASNYATFYCGFVINEGFNASTTAGMNGNNRLQFLAVLPKQLLICLSATKQDRYTILKSISIRFLSFILVVDLRCKSYDLFASQL